MERTVFGNYVLERHLRRGGMADVYLARVVQGHKAGLQVAIKRLRPDLYGHAEYADLFVSEADLGRYLQHPNIVAVIEAGVIDEAYFIAMEFIDGWDLHTVLRTLEQRATACPWPLACHIAYMVALGLHFAHTAKTKEGASMGIVHCDVTPSNIFITRTGLVKLGDFGVAHTRAVGQALQQGLAGKPHYFAPEQVLGESASAATDVFALGVVLYQLLTGKRPFDGADEHAVCRHILRGKPAPPSRHRHDVPRRLDALVLQCLQRRPPHPGSQGVLGRLSASLRGAGAYRFGDAQALAQALHAMMAATPMGAVNVQNLCRALALLPPSPSASP